MRAKWYLWPGDIHIINQKKNQIWTSDLTMISTCCHQIMDSCTQPKVNQARPFQYTNHHKHVPPKNAMPNQTALKSAPNSTLQLSRRHD